MTFNPTLRIEHAGEAFEFTNPSPRVFAKIGARAAAMRQADGLAYEASLSGFDSSLYFGLALFETLLTRADAENNWPFSEDGSGRPVVDSTKFPPNKTQNIVEVGNKFYDTFFGPDEKEAADRQPVPPEGLVSGEAVPVSPVG